MRGKRKEKKRLEKEDGAGLFDQHEQSEQSEQQPRRITPVDIQQREFRLAMRGYHERDVDEFLDEITEEVARLYAENKRLREELGSKGTADFAAGSGASEAEAALREARDEAARILAEAESRARMISAATAAPGSGSPGMGPAVTGAALAGFLSREKSFLQNLAKMMQDHANAMKEDVRRVRENVTEGRAAGPADAAPLPDTDATESAQDAPSRRQPEAEHELWRPQQPSGPSPSASSAPPVPGDLEESPAEPESSGRGQPPYFMDERSPSSEPGSGSAATPTGSMTPWGEDHGEPPERPSVIDVMDVEHPAFQAEPPRPAFEAEPPRPAFGEAPPASPHVDEPTREWTLGEEGADVSNPEEPIVRAHEVPGATARRWAPRTEDEAPGDERSLKELFWGED